MKADQLISRYLAKHGSVSLQGIGRFYFEANAGNSNEDMEIVPHFPEQSIRYEFDKNALEDQSFIDFLSAQTGKKRSLIASDLDSFILTGKQFLNIGKPLVVKDLGILTKNQSGTYEFIQGSNTHEPIDVSAPKSNQQHSNPDDIDFSSVPKNRRKNKNVVLLLIPALVFLAVLIAVGFYYSNSPIKPVESKAAQFIDSTKQKDSILPTKSAIDTNRFLLTKSFSNLREAQQIQSEFLKTGYDIQINVKDSATYAVNVVIPRNINDTFSIKDSILNKLRVLFDVKLLNKP